MQGEWEERFFTESTAEMILSPGYDWVVDAIDVTKHKCLLIARARECGQALLTCGGGGGRIDPTRVRVADLARSINDPLLLPVRKRLRRVYGFPRLKRMKFGIDCVFTDEFPLSRRGMDRCRRSGKRGKITD